MVSRQHPGLRRGSLGLLRLSVRRRPHHHRREGSATTTFPDRTLSGLEAIGRSPWRKVVVWGDSHVEALQVDDPQKLVPQVERLANECGIAIQPVQMAQSGWSVADYWFMMPGIDETVDPERHLIVLGGLGDIAANGLQFTAEPEFAFHRIVLRPALFNLREPLADAGMTVPWRLFHHFRESATGPMRFSPGRVVLHGVQRNLEEEAPTASPPESDRLREWAFALDQLRERTSRPIAFVYVPYTPKIERNHLTLTDPSAPSVLVLRQLCESRGISLIDVSHRFEQFHRSTGRFPRGFANGRPSSGHWNSDGHRLVAEAIVNFLQQPNALHPG